MQLFAECYTHVAVLCSTISSKIGLAIGRIKNHFAGDVNMLSNESIVSVCELIPQI